MNLFIAICLILGFFLLLFFLAFIDVVIVSNNVMCIRGVLLSIWALHGFPCSSLSAGLGAIGAANEECEVQPSAAAQNIMVEQVWAQSQVSNKMPGCHGQPVHALWLQAEGGLFVSL